MGAPVGKGGWVPGGWGGRSGCSLRWMRGGLRAKEVFGVGSLFGMKSEYPSRIGKCIFPNFRSPFFLSLSFHINPVLF